MNEQVQVIDPREGAIVATWREGHLSRGTIINYLYRVRRFRKYCEKRKLIEAEQLTVVGLERFLRSVMHRWPPRAAISTTNLQMKREVLEAFWKRAGLTPAAPKRWQPSPKLLAFLESL